MSEHDADPVTELLHQAARLDELADQHLLAPIPPPSPFDPGAGLREMERRDQRVHELRMRAVAARCEALTLQLRATPPAPPREEPAAAAADPAVIRTMRNFLNDAPICWTGYAPHDVHCARGGIGCPLKHGGVPATTRDTRRRAGLEGFGGSL